VNYCGLLAGWKGNPVAPERDGAGADQGGGLITPGHPSPSAAIPSSSRSFRRPRWMPACVVGFSHNRGMSGQSEEPYVAPRVFTSYSHDSDEHKAWVLQLAHRLIYNGVDVILDQYDLRIGADLPGFIESGLRDADRVLAICSDRYVEKANQRQGGVGYERRILTADIMDNLDSARVIPIIRNNSADGSKLLPSFLASTFYIDFRDDDQYEAKYSELIHEIFGKKIVARPKLGQNPFAPLPKVTATPRLSMQPGRYVSPALSGRVKFNYSNNNGRYVIGSGEMAFTINWNEAGFGIIYVLSDPHDIRSVALAPKVNELTGLGDITRFDNSSRVRTAKVGDAVILENIHGYYAAAHVLRVLTRESSPTGEHEVEFEYLIQPNRTAIFNGALGAQRHA
jgi:TIR domain